MSAPVSNTGNSSYSNPYQQDETNLMNAQNAQYYDNFKLQTEQAMNDNQNQTMVAIGQSHAAASAAATAGASQLGQDNAKIVA